MIATIKYLAAEAASDFSLIYRVVNLDLPVDSMEAAVVYLKELRSSSNLPGSNNGSWSGFILLESPGHPSFLIAPQDGCAVAEPVASSVAVELSYFTVTGNFQKSVETEVLLLLSDGRVQQAELAKAIGHLRYHNQLPGLLMGEWNGAILVVGDGFDPVLLHPADDEQFI